MLIILLVLLSLWSSSANAQASGAIGKAQGPEVLGSLTGWAGQGLSGHPGIVWMSRMISGQPISLLESMTRSPELVRKSLRVSSEVRGDWFELQAEFEAAGEQACQKLRDRRLLLTKLSNIPQTSQALPRGKMDATVMKVESPLDHELVIHSMPIRCSDPQGRRVAYALTRSTVLLIYAAASIVVDQAKRRAKQEDLPSKRSSALIEIAILRHSLLIFRSRAPWFKRNSNDMVPLLDRAQKKTQKRLQRYEARFLENFSTPEDAKLLSMKKGMEPQDWHFLGWGR